MKAHSLMTGLDIGSSKILGVAAESDKNGALAVIAEASSPARGIARGAIVDLNEAVDSVSKTLELLRRKISKRPENIYVNLSGETVKGERSRGMIPLSARGREVATSDMSRCVNAACTVKLPFNREIIHKLVHSFSIDDQPPVKNPLGLYASRLYCEVYVITAGANHADNICKCVNNAGYDTADVVFTGIADGASLIGESDSEGNVLLLDMGASLTEASFFSRGVLDDLSVMAVGAGDLKGDLKASPEFDAMLAKVRESIQEFSKRQGDIDSIIISGGLSFADGIIELMEERLGHFVRMGTVKEIRGEISGLESLKATTALGLISYVHDNMRKEAINKKNIAGNLYSKVIDVFNSYF